MLKGTPLVINAVQRSCVCVCSEVCSIVTSITQSRQEREVKYKKERITTTETPGPD